MFASTYSTPQTIRVPKVIRITITHVCQLNLGHGGVLSRHGPVFSLLSDLKQDCQFQ
ncbi:hypothetical protein HanXRQr2_Chr14g0626021 [Helianthus annuus]|uniref:Uncharacterized protein n=1 Tax=Helianthus annuus TaxID=4232 RepID=A0A9K3E7Q8_HELAN|nr:hypothetical protein HanXRQr2_Chr14g0626021 [Helianthus annuus]